MTRRIITAILLLFVAGAVVTLVVKKTRTTQAAVGAVPPVAAAEATSPPKSTVVAYYLHGNKRCSACMKMEAYTKTAIDERLAADLANGVVVFRSVNIDEAANAHFVDDFQLTTKSVVLAEERDGKVLRWQDLKLVWDLVGDEPGFKEYIVQGLSSFRSRPAP